MPPDGRAADRRRSIKKAMKLKEGPKDGLQVGEVEMIIRLRRAPDGHAYVDTRLCGSFITNPIVTAQGVMETVPPPSPSS